MNIYPVGKSFCFIISNWISDQICHSHATLSHYTTSQIISVISLALSTSNSSSPARSRVNGNYLKKKKKRKKKRTLAANRQEFIERLFDSLHRELSHKRLPAGYPRFDRVFRDQSLSFIGTSVINQERFMVSVDDGIYQRNAFNVTIMHSYAARYFFPAPKIRIFREQNRNDSG